MHDAAKVSDRYAMAHLAWHEGALHVQAIEFFENARLYNLVETAQPSVGWYVAHQAIFRNRAGHEHLAWPKDCRIALVSLIEPMFVQLERSLNPYVARFSNTNGDVPPLLVGMSA